MDEVCHFSSRQDFEDHGCRSLSNGQAAERGHPLPSSNLAFPRSEEDMWKVGSISIWKTECFQHQQRSDWLAAM